MNRKFLPAILILFLSFNTTHAEIDTRLTMVSNSFNTPTNGFGTLIIDVEAQATDLLPIFVEVSDFENAFLLDSVLISKIISVNFSDQLFDILNYNTFEEYQPDSGIVRYSYNFESGTRETIASLGWTPVVRITIEYTMTPASSTITWFTGTPDYYVTDNGNNNITGSEEEIPQDLIEFPLPVELNSFTTKINGSSVILNWQTETEVNNYGFEIERKSRNQAETGAWENIGFAPGNGNSNSIKNYSFVDNNPEGGKQYSYRLKQIDITGSFAYSNEIMVEININKFELYQNYPNPFNPTTSIRFTLPNSSRVKLDIFNIIGEHVTTLLDKEMEAGFHSILFDANNLPGGAYIYKIRSENFSQTRKMLLLK